MADLDEETLEKLDRSKTVQAEKSQIKDINLTTWYHEGSDDLVNARKFIAEYRIWSYFIFEYVKILPEQIDIFGSLGMKSNTNSNISSCILIY